MVKKNRLFIVAKASRVGLALGLCDCRSQLCANAAVVVFAAMMETAACAGIWTNARCADAYLVSPICEICGNAPGTDYHRYRACLGNDLIDGSIIQRTNFLNAPAAERGSQCLFPRGIIPAAMIPINPPRQALVQFVGICINTQGPWRVSV